MSFLRSFLVLSAVSLIAALVLLAAGFVMENRGGYLGGYAALSVDVSVEDKTVLERLDAGSGYFGGSPVSASSQWVALDDFGSMETVFLDNLFSRITTFDPRNDGYAEKLKDFFIQDGKRFIFIPLKTGYSGSSGLDKQFVSLMGGIPFSVDYYGIGKPYKLFFITYAAASFILLIICYVKKNVRAATAGIVSLLPGFSSFAFFGAPGIACAAMLLGLFIILREPLNELLTKLVSGEGAGRAGKIKKTIEQYKLYWYSLPVFGAAVTFIVVFSELKLFFVISAFFAAAAVSFFSDRVLSQSVERHRRFTPVLIVKRKFPDFDFSIYMAPFAAAVLFVMILAPHTSAAVVSGGKFSSLIEEKDYYAHLDFQASFSTRQLGMIETSYPGFIIDKDGLPSPDINGGINSTVLIENFPPFPLKHLMAFLGGVNSGSRIGTGETAGEIGEYLSMLILLIFIIPGILLMGKLNFSPKGSFSGLKRAAGKLRWADKNRKNTLLLKGKNLMNLRKDA